jgi:hypothetical protein
MSRNTHTHTHTHHLDLCTHHLDLYVAPHTHTHTHTQTPRRPRAHTHPFVQCVRARPHARMGQAWICRKSSSQTLKRCVGGGGGGDNERKFMGKKIVENDAGRLLHIESSQVLFTRMYTRTHTHTHTLSLSHTHTHTYTNMFLPVGSCLLVRDAGAVAYPICFAAHHCCRYLCKNKYTNIMLKTKQYP